MSDRGSRASLRLIMSEFSKRPPKRVALVIDDHSVALPAWIRRRWPEARLTCIVSSTNLRRLVRLDVVGGITVVAVCNVSDRHGVLSAYGPFDLIVDAVERTEEERIGTLQTLFFHLRRRGRYVTTDLGWAEGGDPDAVVRSVSVPGQRVVPTRACSSVKRRGRAVSIGSAVSSWPKMRYSEMDEVLRRRPVRGSVLSSIPAMTFRPAAGLSMNRERPPVPLASVIQVPTLGVREYNDVTCLPHQVLVSGGVLLPDSYRHYLNRTLTHRRITDLSNEFAVRKRSSVTVDLPGSYFYLGSEFPQHFGHVMTEQLSRLWAWADVKAKYPTIRALVDLRRQYDSLQPWEIELFVAAGIAEEDLVAVSGAAKVEHLVAAAPMLVNTQYIHPSITKTWRRVAGFLAARAPQRKYPPRIFVSRRPTLKNRRCRNAEDVETFFRDSGFAVIYPEDHCLAEQAMLFRQADTVAGFAGSAMFNLAFCEPTNVIMLWPETYTSRNEYLICSAAGHRLSIFWCQPDIDHPQGQWDYAAYQSTYSFDFEHDGRLLAEAVARQDSTIRKAPIRSEWRSHPLASAAGPSSRRMSMM